MKRLVPKISNLQRHVFPCVQRGKVICQVGSVHWNELLSLSRINNRGHSEHLSAMVIDDVVYLDCVPGTDVRMLWRT